MANVIGRLGRYGKEQIRVLRKAMVTLIVRTLERSMKFRIEDGLIMPSQSYSRFVKLVIRTKSTKIITFNYDIGLDQALLAEGMTYNYNLSGNGPGEINLLKLHGSINWGKANDGTVKDYPIENYIKDTKIPRNKTETTIEIGSSIVNLNRYSEGRTFDDLPIIVPPTWNKTEYQSSLTNVWAAAAQALSETSVFLATPFQVQINFLDIFLLWGQ